LLETAELSSKVVPFCVPTSNYYTSSPKSGVVGVVDFGHSNTGGVVALCRLNLQFPNDIWRHLCTYLFPIWVALLVRCLFRPFAQFLIDLFIFSLLSYQSSLIILDNSPLSAMSFRTFFFPVSGLSSHSLHLISF
jgi:hypothetical protein